MLNNLKTGDWVIYRKQKVSSSPGPRAQSTMPAAKGENYNYIVEKFWVVCAVADGMAELVTRRGKRHRVPLDDHRLRRARWWERLIHGSRFRAVQEQTAPIPRNETEGVLSQG